MTTVRQFPILPIDEDAPASIPWAMIAPHEPQAIRNHAGQSLAGSPNA